jgi:pimeloyl-ACP methyl ester carboxylesterase
MEAGSARPIYEMEMSMQTAANVDPFPHITSTNVGSSRALSTGRVLSILAVLFLVFDSIGKLMEVEPVVAGTKQLGYPANVVFSLGVIQLLCIVAYVIPGTSVLGAVLLTGYLGGAVATHVRVDSPLFSHTLFPIYIASLVWGGLLLRDARLRVFLPWRIGHDQGIGFRAREEAMEKAISKDGTAIAYERSGKGPALILVDGALCSRAFGPMPKLAPLLAQQFTVFTYDRRGRGQSGDTQPYSREREVEDIAALIQEAGGSAFLVGLSSGGALALEAAASGLAVKKVAAYEPPFVNETGQHSGAEHERQLKKLLAAGNRGGAVKYFMRTMVGVPAAAVIMMRLMPWIWRKLESVAHTLPYDAAVMNEFRVPTTRFASIRIPTLVMHGSKTDVRLQNAARTVAEAVPGAQHLTLAEQTHNVKPAALTPAVVKFFAD